MTEHEYLQNILYLEELMGTWQQNFIAVFFAYLITSHIYGKTLSQFIAIGASIIYTFFGVSICFALSNSANQMHILVAGLVSTYPQASAYFPLLSDISAERIVVFTLAPLILAWVASLFYMHFCIRREPAKNA